MTGTCKILGIVFPVYYARLPLIVENFIKKLEVDKDTYVFAVATHGGAPATVLNILSNTLQNNGVNLNSAFLIHMPANNIFAYGAKPIERYNKTFKKEKIKVKRISEFIKKTEDHKYEKSNIIIDRILVKIFIKTTDKIMDKFHTRDNEFWVKDTCNGCRICEKVCSVKNIEFKEDKPVWNHKCEQCTACIQYCPKEAIQWGKKSEKRKRYRNPNININEIM